MFTTRLKARTTYRAQTDPWSDDPRLLGRTYAIPFEEVWRTCMRFVEEHGHWRMLQADDLKGFIRVRCTTMVFRFEDPLEIRIGLDENALTRVDVQAGSRGYRLDLGMNVRRVGRFFKKLDRLLGAGQGKILDPRETARFDPAGLMREGLASLGLCVLLYACVGDAPAPPTTEPGLRSSESADRNFEDGLYERNVVFMTVDADSAIVVPWFFRTSSSEEGVERLTEGWLARAGLWEPFFHDQWITGPTRTPFRIQPRGPMDLVVGAGGTLERILFVVGQRQLEVVIDEGMLDWSGNRGETFRVHQGAALFGDQRVEGIVLDMNRARLREGPEPGEWIFVTGPRRLAIVVEAPGGSPAYTAWGRMGEEEFRWPEVQVEWSSVRSFEEARRDVPVEWGIRSLDGELEVTLASAGMELRALEGEGPILPVDGLFQVTGSVVLAGDSLEVRGLVRHVQR